MTDDGVMRVYITSLETGWNLCRRGIFRPVVAMAGGYETAERSDGEGYSITD